MPYLNRGPKMYSVMFIIILGAASLFIFSSIQHNIETSQLAYDMCTADLDKARFQLSMISDYKNGIDQALNNTKQAHEKDKKNFGEILDSCLAMKFQFSYCQTQLKNLQMERKTIMEQLPQLINEVEECRMSKDLPGFG